MQNPIKIDALITKTASGGIRAKNLYNDLIKSPENFDTYGPKFSNLLALLLLRMGKPREAKEIAKSSLILAISCFSLKEIDKSERLLSKFLAKDPQHPVAINLLSLLYLRQRPTSNMALRNHIKLTNNNTNNAKLNIDLFFNCINHGVPLDTALEALDKSLTPKRSTKKVPRCSLIFQNKSILDLKNDYEIKCSKALSQIEKIFSIKIVPGEYAWDDYCPIWEISTVIGKEYCRQEVNIEGAELGKASTKGLQMLFKPKYWAMSQDELFAILCRELKYMSPNPLSADGRMKLHEIGPGCGYMMKLLSNIDRIEVSGTDVYCFDKFSVLLQKSTPEDFRSFFDQHSLEYFAYEAINTIIGFSKLISGCGIGLNEFSERMLDADVVYSHQPVIDQLEDPVWDARKWLSFFENIFTKESSRVRIVVIALNAHSDRGIVDKAQNIKNDIFELEVILGKICQGVILVARKK